MSVNSLGEQGAQWRAAFQASADWFARVSEAAVGRLDRQALGAWTVRDLLGHTSRALSTTDIYLREGAPGPAVIRSAVDYYRTAVRQARPQQIADRGRAAGAALGADPAGVVTDLADRALERVAGAPDDAHLGTPFGAIALAEYLPTRTFELVVHTCDLLAALEMGAQVPDAASGSALRLAAALAQSKGAAADLLLGMTGRRDLPKGFTVL